MVQWFFGVSSFAMMANLPRGSHFEMVFSHFTLFPTRHITLTWSFCHPKKLDA